MKRAEVLALRLKELREWHNGLSLDAPDLPVVPDDPLCAALWIWKGDPPEMRRELLVRRLRYRIEQLEDERQREALLVAFRLHPDYRTDEDIKIKSRRERLAGALHFESRTIFRAENAAIERIANDLVADLADPVRFFGRKNTNVYLVFGRPMAKWRAWMTIIVPILIIAAIAFNAGMWVMWRYQMVPFLEYLK